MDIFDKVDNNQAKEKSIEENVLAYEISFQNYEWSTYTVDN